MQHPPLGPRIRVEVPCDLAAVDEARTRITDAATAWGFGAVGDLELVASELLTNAIVHGQSPSVATCRMLDAGGLEIAVHDQGPGSPQLREPDGRSLSGRGLRIVEALSSSWGVEDEPDDDGKTVWARLGR